MSKRAFDLGAELRKAGGPTVGPEREQIEYIDLDRIDPDPENFYSLEGIDELAGSIELVGLQQPLRVRDGERGHVTVVSGHRRRIACMMIRDGGSEMFKAGVPCIREKAEELPEMQELKLIFGNAQTRVMSAPEMSRQAVKTRDLLARLRDRGYDFPGRTRELVASVLQTSDSRVGRLTAIRERLVPELLKYFDGDKLGETVAYRLSQEDRATQLTLAIQLGPEVQDLSKDTVEKVIEQAKKAGKENTDCHTSAAALARNDGGPIVVHSEDIDDAPPVEQILAERPAKEYDAIDGLKKYLDARHDEDARFWKYMQDAADNLIQHSFSAGALPNRKDNIDMLRLDCRNAGVAGYAADWQGSNKGITLQHLSRGGGISRTWTEVYDMLAAIAITRWRAVLTEERRKPKKALEPPPVFVPVLFPEWRTGEPERDGRYLCRVDMGLNKPHEQTCEYKGGVWSCFGRPIDEVGKVVSWWPLPERG
ncbi:MAG: ParB/RepB/Spo0J family partition protein [Succiniclasticum sp.]|nr:ParB/RepB/Spo0J family partition protein [Succiniclasticum sp.]